jgi:long-chain fatty acid transport protein
MFAVAGLAALVSTSAYASGFAIMEQSVSGLGNAFAGGAAGAEDASTVYFNPAGMTRLEGTQAVGGVHAILPSFTFKNEGSTHALTGQTGEGLIGDNGGDGGTLGVVPNLYVTHALSSDWFVGLGVNAPFGLVTEYDDYWVGRYHGVTSGITTVNVNPAVAYKDGDMSLGVGLSLMYMDAELSQMVDFGTLTVAAGGIPQREDGKAELTADGWSYGFNVGFLYEPSENTRVGVHYRSQVHQTLEGEADFTVPAKSQAILDALGSAAFQDTTAEGDIALPDSLSISVYHRFNPKLAMMADALWTNWATFEDLTMVFGNPAQPDSVTTENWKEVWRLALGGTYSYSEKLDLRCGIAYDETPIPSAAYRTPRLPDEDRVWLSAGAGYEVFNNAKLDVAYTHLFGKDAKINKDPVGEDESRGGLKGTAEVSGDIFSAQVSMRW